VPIEYEAKILDIDPAEIAARILAAGGQQVSETRLQRRYVYDITPGDQSRWLRLRDAGTGEITLTVKEIAHDGIDGTHETEVAVSDFDGTNQLLAKLGYRPKGYQENRRTSYCLADAHLDLDEWPLIPPYLEIEADSPAVVHHAVNLLGYAEQDLTSENTTKVYRRYGIDLAEHSDLRFRPDPESDPLPSLPR
jgi:adenylate cyclase, class 2